MPPIAGIPPAMFGSPPTPDLEGTPSKLQIPGLSCSQRLKLQSNLRRGWALPNAFTSRNLKGSQTRLIHRLWLR
jgi:hypothetical protein